MRRAAGAAVLLAALAAGCGRDNDVRVYKLAKADDATQPAAGAPPSAMPAPETATGGQARLTWTLPTDWQEKPPSEMRVASFTVSGKGGQTADVSVIPLPTGGSELDLVNMWRQQMRLAPATSDAADGLAEPVVIGTDPGKLFDIPSQEAVLNGKDRARILVAMVTRGPMSWFFKMTGEAGFVGDQKPVFVEFLKSIKFPAVDMAAGGAEPMQFSDPHRFLSTNAKEAPSDNSEKPVWVVPSDWHEVAPSQFLLAKFETGEGDGKAEISVSMLAGEGGGVLANVNRWRRQLGLEPVDDAGLVPLESSVDTDGGKAVAVDLKGMDPKTGQAARMVGVIVPQSGRTWFYKLMGNEATVQKEKAVFTRFVQTIKYPDAP